MAMTTSDIFINEDHSRTIVHIDLDCFYAQVEMIKNPKLRQVPLGIQQKQIVVTSNYVAREMGIKKCMMVTDACKICPNLVLVKGEDLYDYRQMSAKVTSCLQKFSNLVEKLGLDENFIDISALVSERLTNSKENIKPVGHVYSADENCDCGCVERLNIGSVIASEMRECLKKELEITSCAGIAHNKLIAKLGGAVNKPNQQTVVYPSSATQLLFNLPDVRSIPGIGQAVADNLKLLKVRTVPELQECPLEKLEKLFGTEKAKVIMNLSFGKDATAVKSTGKPLSIGLEDSCRSISVETEIKDKFLQLLNRLMLLVNEDGRIPRTIKVTVRKFDTSRKTSLREQRQCNISPSFFTTKHFLKLSQSSEEKIMTVIMRLFHKLVDINKPFHITLLGLAFTKFQERQTGKQSIASFLMNNISVQSVTSLQSTRDSSNISSPMDCSPTSLSDFNTDGSESEVEPSPKKGKFGKLIAKRRCFNSSVDCPSPSKLRVSELRLNSREMERLPIENCPEDVDPEVFNELPSEVQQELIQQWKTEKKTLTPATKPKTNTLLKYLIKNK